MATHFRGRRRLGPTTWVAPPVDREDFFTALGTARAAGEIIKAEEKATVARLTKYGVARRDWRVTCFAAAKEGKKALSITCAAGDAGAVTAVLVAQGIPPDAITMDNERNLRFVIHVALAFGARVTEFDEVERIRLQPYRYATRFDVWRMLLLLQRGRASVKDALDLAENRRPGFASDKGVSLTWRSAVRLMRGLEKESAFWKGLGTLPDALCINVLTYL